MPSTFRNIKIEDLIERLKPFLEKSGLKNDMINSEWFQKIIELVKVELTTLAEVGSHISIFFDDKYKLTAEAGEILKKDNAQSVVKVFTEYLDIHDDDPHSLYSAAIKHVKEKTGAKGKELFMPIRAALTGKTHGPELDKIFVILGRAVVLRRLNPFIN